jgi:hypothetical protein
LPFSEDHVSGEMYLPVLNSIRLPLTVMRV